MRVERDRRTALAVMAKAPIPGEAKTRLAANLGYPAAAAIYEAFLVDTLAVLESAAARSSISSKFVICPNERHAAQLREIVGTGWEVLAQRRAGLMGGIVDAFDSAFAAGAKAAVVTDADSPLTLSEHVEHYIELAPDRDIALGPTDDGGYYVITARSAARRHLVGLLLEVMYDSSTICAATAERARSLGLDVGVGPVGSDVDTMEDLYDLASRVQGLPPELLSRTRDSLARLDVDLTFTASGRTSKHR